MSIPPASLDEIPAKRSMERVATSIEQYCTFPVVERVKLFSFFTGNEDMHLNNFFLIRREGKVELSPAHDLINTTIAIGNAQGLVQVESRSDVQSGPEQTHFSKRGGCAQADRTGFLIVPDAPSPLDILTPLSYFTHRIE
jgi:hypothetical protein